METTSQQISKNRTILIVDDSLASLKIIIPHIEKEGYITSVAKNGKTALKRAQHLKPDLILLDIIMTGMDGFETCRKLKEDISTRDIPVIFMSSLQDTVNKVKGFEVGVSDYITKPFDVAEVLARIKLHLSIRFMQHELELTNEQLKSTQDDLKQLNQNLENQINQRTLQLKEAHETLKKNEALLSETGHMAKVGGWELDTKTLNVSWTKETYRIHEVPMDYKPPLQEAIYFFHFDDRPKLELAIQKALEHGDPYDMEIRFTTAKGKNLWTRTICKPVIENGKTIKLIGTFQDITQRVNDERRLEKTNKELTDSNKKLRTTEKQLEKSNFELKERLKEINCLYQISQFTQKHDLSLDEVIQSSLKIIPPSWQYPEITGCRIIVDQKKYQTANFKKTKWSQKAKIKIQSNIRGIIEVCYLKERPIRFEGPFLKEERLLLNEIAKVIGEYAERKQIESELEEHKNNLEEIVKKRTETLTKLSKAVECSPASVVITDIKGNIEYVNKKFTEITGYTSEEAIGENPKILKSGLHTKSYYKELWGTIHSGKDWSGELCNKKKNGDFYWESVRISPIHNEKNQKTHFVAIKEDITARRQQEEELKKANLLSNISLDMTNTSYWTYCLDDPDYFLVSDKLVGMLGLKKNNENKYHLVNDWYEGMAAYDEKLANETVEKLKDFLRNNIPGKKYQVTHPFIRVDNKKLIWAKNIGEVTKRDDDGNPLELTGVLQDITMQKHQEIEIAKSRQQLQDVFDSAPNIMLLVEKSGRIHKINRTGAEMTDVNSNDAVGMLSGEVFQCLTALLKKDTCGLHLNCKKCSIRNPVTETFDTGKNIYKRKGTLTISANGEPYKMSLLISTALLSQDDGPLVFLSIDDITKQEKQELEIIESRKRLESLFENMTNGFAELEVICNVNDKPVDGRFLSLNPAFAKQTGLTNDVIGKTIKEVIPEFPDSLIEQYGNVGQTGNPISLERYSEIVDKHFKINVFSNQKGQFAVVYDDITESKKHEEAINDANFIANMSLELAKSGSWFIDMENHPERLYFNKKLLNILGEEVSEDVDYIPTESWMSNIMATNPELGTKGREFFELAIKDSEFNFDTIMQYTKPNDEQVVWLRAIAEIVSDEKGNPVKVYGVTQDITDSKNIELEIANKEQNFRSLFEGSTDAVIIVNPSKNSYLDCNKAMVDLLGMPSKEKILKSNPGSFSPEYQPNGDKSVDVLKRVITAALNNQPSRVEYTIKHSSGMHLICDASVSKTIFNNEVAVQYIIRDITEQKSIQKNLMISEKNLSEAQRIAHLGNWNWDITGNKLLLSDEAYRIFGFKPNQIEITYDVFINAVHPDDREKVQKAVNKSIADKTPYSIEHRSLLPDNSIRYVHELGESYYDEKGNPTRMIGTVLDITERKLAEQEIAQKGKNFRNLFELSPNAIFILQPKTGKIIDCNEIAIQLFQAPSRDFLMGLTPADASPELQPNGKNSGELALQHIQEAFVKGSKKFEFLHQHFNGETFPCDIVLGKTNYNNEHVIQAFVQDITARKKAEQEIKNRTKELINAQAQLVQSEKMASLGQLTAGIAHEINNPVNFIHNSSYALKQDLTDIIRLVEKYNEYLRSENKDINAITDFENKIDYKSLLKAIKQEISDIQVGTKRTSEIVKGLREFSHLDPVEMEPADIHRGINTTINLLKSRLSKHITLTQELDPSIGLIKCHIGLLNQVFMNLLTNALDAINGNGEIIITTKCGKNSIIISIKDDGPGISKDIKDRVFDPFFTTKQIGQGTGLGLSISHGIIEKHQGTITMNSKVGHGTEFIIKLPK